MIDVYVIFCNIYIFIIFNYLIILFEEISYFNSLHCETNFGFLLEYKNKKQKMNAVKSQFPCLYGLLGVFGSNVSD